ncbi:trehalose-phosphatase [Methanomassiliicoccus luminyensis]|uniref:trehalose-phosphatase n=1 Tax=Methanomassiliicoccus luminyensis TaxID=1080712 RepID=UPI0003762802|nr:trehalose-phosphatase [Methanomassiliicoccus luminyensis]
MLVSSKMIWGQIGTKRPGTLEIRTGERDHVDLDGFDAFILDLDGVVTDTARIHAAAWKLTFDEYLQDRARRQGETFVPFDEDIDYLRFVNGKPRYDGVRDFLASRGIALDPGDPSDPPERETVRGIGNRKNLNFIRWLDEHGAEPYPSTVEFVRALRSRGIRVALFSSSRNARRVLQAAGVSGLFDAVVDGCDAADLGLPGKPAPDVLIEAARRVGAEPGRAAVVEDALAGVEAGRDGGFALVVGVDRAGQASELRKYGADVVVKDLSEIKVEASGHEWLPSALEHRGDIFRRLRDGVPAIFLDYDGTLTPIVNDPARAIISEDMRGIVRELSEECLVSIVSGRDLQEVRAMMGLDGLIYVGSHGYDMAGPKDIFSDHARGTAFLPALDGAEAELKEAVRGIEGARVERKRFAIAVHYRNADPGDVPELERRFDSVACQYADLSKIGGKKVFELRPHMEWDKGKVVLYLLGKFHVDGTHVVPLYIGDDVTDEDAFRAIDGRGITVLVSDSEQETAADFVLRDVSEVREFLGALLDMFERENAAGTWALEYEGYRPEEEGLREALCTLGNGYLATRGAAPESSADGVHYPGTYLAGTYNRLRSEVDGREMENESMVNVPNWLPFVFSVGGGEWFDPCRVDVREYRQELDMRRGVLSRTVRFTDRRGRRTSLHQRRFVSMDAQHLAGLETTIVPENWSGPIRMLSALDGRVENSNVRRYRKLRSRHLEPVLTGSRGDTMWLQAETNQSHVRISEAARTRVFVGEEEVAADRTVAESPGYVSQELVVDAREGRPIRVEKIAAVYSSRDRAVSEGLMEALNDLDDAGDFSELAGEHMRAWDRIWKRAHVDVEAEHTVIQQILDLHIFHLIQTASVHSSDLDVGVPPRGLHGEAYRGLIMWDEVFVLPFLAFRIPYLVRSLLLYRYRRLPRARVAARLAGYDGAMFPWQSGSDGREESQTMHLNPISGRWIPDHTYLERHIGLAVAYSVWQYYQITADLDFMRFYGTEMLVEIARFWASKARYNEARGRYEILEVMGPDEFHERYPGADRPGIDNNAYTNVMAVWTLCRASDALELLPAECRGDLRDRLSISDHELERWDDISRRMVVPFHGDGIISQFEGYDDLEELDWDALRASAGDIHRLDRVLEARGDTPDRYKVSKQADVLMLFYLLSADELGELFDRLGYRMEHNTIPKTIDYYMQRTSHGSTLSRVVHAWVLSRSNRDMSWSLFLEALRSDVSDIQGGTTHEGIHLGAMAGTVDMVQRCYSGLEVRKGVLWFEPRLPVGLRKLRFGIEYRRNRVEVDIGKDVLRVYSRPQDVAPVLVGFRGAVHELAPGGTLEFKLDRKGQR